MLHICLIYFILELLPIFCNFLWPIRFFLLFVDNWSDVFLNIIFIFFENFIIVLTIFQLSKICCKFYIIFKFEWKLKFSNFSKNFIANQLKSDWIFVEIFFLQISWKVHYFSHPENDLFFLFRFWFKVWEYFITFFLTAFTNNISNNFIIIQHTNFVFSEQNNSKIRNIQNVSHISNCQAKLKCSSLWWNSNLENMLINKSNLNWKWPFDSLLFTFRILRFFTIRSNVLLILNQLCGWHHQSFVI